MRPSPRQFLTFMFGWGKALTLEIFNPCRLGSWGLTRSGERRQFTQTFQMGEGKSSASEPTQHVDGYLLHTADEKQVFQARMDGFSFNRLKPYETWEALRDEAKRLWGLYEEVASPEIQRIGLHYINKIDIPMPVRDFKDYLAAGPPVPEGRPQGVNSFFTRVVIAEPKFQATAIITQAFEQIVDPNFLPLYLDIDVSKQIESGKSLGVL